MILGSRKNYAFINSSLKKWIYADLLLKPEETLLFRPVQIGGLGFVSVKHKATAFLIRTFLELSANSAYQSSQYLNSLYRFHILGEDVLCPPLPPYYPTNFFKTILEAKTEGKECR